MKVLFIGDIVGRPGRRALARMLPGLRRELSVDFTIANGENSAGGFGITRETFEEIVAAGVDVVTGGNHTWQAREISTLLDGDLRLLRPANYPAGAPGRGAGVFRPSGARGGAAVGVVNLEGRIFMEPLDSWGGISMDASPRWWGRTHTCRRPMSASFRAAPRSSRTSA